jgi:hypothetical protein
MTIAAIFRRCQSQSGLLVAQGGRSGATRLVGSNVGHTGRAANVAATAARNFAAQANSHE